jgi:hypothetical protein
MTTLDQALSLAARGYHVFPLRSNGKLPVHTGWQEEATRDPETIRRTWGKRNFNVGISTSKFNGHQALVAVDIDVKKGKHGDQTLIALELQGCEFPSTYEQGTPSGGSHLVYVCDEAMHQGADVLGNGLDIRSRGGYIVGAGSVIDGKEYVETHLGAQPVECPAWLRARLGVDRGGDRAARSPLPGVDLGLAADRALAYLRSAPVASLGSRGSTAYKIAARLRDFGCEEAQAYDLMAEHWAERCDPPMPLEDLSESVNHAYRYAKEQQGAAAPEANFQPVAPDPEADDRHPVDRMNDQYAFTPAGGGHIIWETTDPKGKPVVKHLDLNTFHTLHASQKLAMGEKRLAITKLWLESPGRRTYDGFVFAPQRDMGPRWYNLWRGFSYDAATCSAAASAAHPAVAAFLEHARENVCHDEPALFRWLMGYFAHLVQRPWEKPLVALVFKGLKGTGKNALIERVGALLGGHFLLSSKRRYLVGQFNGHLENCLCMALDEAFWSGDKESEGVLKDLITGSEHVIEHKGKESFKVDNLTRVIILGNEKWLVPASQDERRFAVFELGVKRMQDRAFFEAMRVGMEKDGYPHLLNYLLSFDLAGIDLNQAPDTQALVDQKVASFEPMEQWWLECLNSGQITGGDWGGAWPEDVPTNRLREALERWARKQHITSRMPDATWFGRLLGRMAPHFTKRTTTAAKRQEGDTSKHYHSPGLDQLRADFQSYLGGTIEWTD